MMATIRRRLARLEATNPETFDIVDVRKATDAQLEAYIIACDIEAREAAGMPAIEYERPLSDARLSQIGSTDHPAVPGGVPPVCRP